MDDYLKQLLEKNLKASEESLAILKKMHRAALWNRFFFGLKLIIIIGVLVWSYISLQPYLKSLLGTYQQLNQLLPSSKGGSFNFGDLLKGLGK